MSRADLGAPVSVESSGKKAAKVLKHIEIHPQLGGGVNIQHHYTSYQHEPRSYKFGADEGARAMAHIARHAGLVIGEQDGSQPDEKQEE
jgi:hypothetical protein